MGKKEKINSTLNVLENFSFKQNPVILELKQLAEHVCFCNMISAIMIYNFTKIQSKPLSHHLTVHLVPVTMMVNAIHLS